MRLLLPISDRKLRMAVLFIVLLSWIVTGCSSKPAPPASAQAGKGSAKGSETNTSGAQVAMAPRRSVFKVGNGVRDPFFPEVKRVETTETVVAPKELPAEELKALLVAGFQGIMGTPDKRMALIHNTVLEPRKAAQVVARVEGKEYRLALRCLDITRESVTVQVDGQAVPITIDSPKVGSF